ncbi:SufD family Fe-S cluster assembly protein [Uliginosibacterium flavum]|uniref:SufD family Fe-S cluster assembly protein n=1 Tax=Uliginosibacterium flavum TaxID=1396831 RepID=A0ABV2TIS4_9RHOO
MPDFQPILTLFNLAGQHPPAIPQAAHLVAYGQQLSSLRSLPGVKIEAESSEVCIAAHITIAAGVRLDQPVHLCFGMFEQHGEQDVHLTLTLEPGAQAELWSHCLFATPQAARHAMHGEFRLMEGAVLRYQEAHFHGTSGNIEVIPCAQVLLEKAARFHADFSLIRGRVGLLDMDYRVDVGEAGVAELLSRAYGFATDAIRIREQVELNGPGARGLLKTRVAVRGHAHADVCGIMEGNAAGARGHIDCMEVVRDQATASAEPQVRVCHPQAKITHEAAIGSVDSKQLETLMARGVTPDEAVDLIVRGMLA